MESNAVYPKISNAQQIIDIIDPIPADLFIIGEFGERKDNKSCFIGHINRALAKDPTANYDGFGTRQLTAKFLKEVHGVQYSDGATVNNSPYVNEYTESEIKDRVMHMLNDMKEHGY